VELERFEFKAHRALEWEVRIGGRILETAMPAPFEARFPEREVNAPVEPVDPEGDWRKVSGKWAFVSSPATTSTMLNVVREKLLLPARHRAWRRRAAVRRSHAGGLALEVRAAGRQALRLARRALPRRAAADPVLLDGLDRWSRGGFVVR
jgi:hypothetical protein